MDKELMIESVDLDFPGTAFRVYKFYQISSGAVAERSMPIFHHHLFYEFHFLTKGEYDFITQDKTIKISQGELFIIPPGTRHYTFQQSAETESIVLSLTIDEKPKEEGFYGYFKKSLDDAALMPVKVSDNLMQNFAQFGRITNCANIKNYCYMKRMVCDILVDLFDMLNGFDTCSKSGAAGKSKKQTELFLENYVNDPAFTLADIAEKLHYSQRHVARMIQNKYGMALGDVRNLQMVKTARRYLDEGCSVQKAAEMADFKSTDTFRKCFKKFEGVTPSAYKRRVEHDGKNR